MFDHFTHNFGTITSPDITHHTIFIQFYASMASNVGSTQQTQFAPYCTILLQFYRRWLNDGLVTPKHVAITEHKTVFCLTVL